MRTKQSCLLVNRLPYGPVVSMAGLLFLQFLGASGTQGTVSSIPIVGSISPEGFLSLNLLLVVIIVTVVIIVVILVVVVVAIVGVVIVVAIIRIVVVVMITGVVVVVGGWAYAFHQDRASLVRVLVAKFPVFATRVPVGPMFLLGLLALAIIAACASRATAMLSTISCWMAAKVMAGVLDVDDSTEILEFKTSRDRYRDNGMSDPIGGLVFKGLRKIGW
ncbi:hypothetical protein Tco_0648839 [Tanacetum coccineum]